MESAGLALALGLCPWVKPRIYIPNMWNILRIWVPSWASTIPKTVWKANTVMSPCPMPYSPYQSRMWCPVIAEGSWAQAELPLSQRYSSRESQCWRSRTHALFSYQSDALQWQKVVGPELSHRHAKDSRESQCWQPRASGPKRSLVAIP